MSTSSTMFLLSLVHCTDTTSILTIAIPDNSEDSVRKAIAQLYYDDYLESCCRDFMYQPGFGSYFDVASWSLVRITVQELQVLKSLA
jgi:hypothetical protein